MNVEFEGEVFRWDSRREGYFLVALPVEISDMIREIPRPRRGFGSIRVSVQIGETVWRTSLFPDSTKGSYVLPLKRAVMAAEAITGPGEVHVSLRILDL